MARLSQRKVWPQNSTVPSKCWSGSPWPRRLTSSRNGTSCRFGKIAFKSQIKLEPFLPQDVRQEMLRVQTRVLDPALFQ